MSATNLIVEESFSAKSKLLPPQKLHNITKQKNTRIPSGYDSLNLVEQTATELRARYVPYRKIADILLLKYGRSYNEVSIRHWFSVNNKCHAALLEIRQKNIEEKQRDLENALPILRELAIDAIGILGESMYASSITESQKDSAKDILDRAGFPKTAKIEGKQEVNVKTSEEFTSALTAIASNLKK